MQTHTHKCIGNKSTSHRSKQPLYFLLHLCLALIHTVLSTSPVTSYRTGALCCQLKKLRMWTHFLGQIQKHKVKVCVEVKLTHKILISTVKAERRRHRRASDKRMRWRGGDFPRQLHQKFLFLRQGYIFFTIVSHLTHINRLWEPNCTLALHWYIRYSSTTAPVHLSQCSTPTIFWINAVNRKMQHFNTQKKLCMK